MKIKQFTDRLFSKNQNKKPSKFGTFGGVFTPDVLTILGVIMYLRLGWVVGNAGLLGAILIIVLAKIITIATGLSMSSITTNIKIGAGGAYSIISKSLGLEAGGSVGIPFYFSQTFAAALYIIGFTEGWTRIFPDHDYMTVIVVVWSVVLAISYISTAFALKIQYIIFVVIGLSILSFFLTPNEPQQQTILIGKFEDAGFWEVFAIFFPAVTGIMAGANLSGDLKEPRKAIPVGTLSSILVTMIIYIALAYMAATYISPEQLRTNQMFMVDNSLVSSIVLAGILAATFSSALGSIIGAPRILQALAENKSIPFHSFFAKKTKLNEPRNAIIFTGILIITSLLLADLNALATIITLFFLITYGMLNLVVFIQQSMKIISFRPSFKISRIIPFIGAVGSTFVMLLIDPIFSVIAIAVILGIYIWLTRRGLQSEDGDIRGGMFLALAEYASRIATKFPRHQVTWKPDLLIPIEDPNSWAGSLLFIKNLVYPSGSIFSFTVNEEEPEKMKQDLTELLGPLERDGIMIYSTVIEDSGFMHGAKTVIQTLRGGALRPNTLFVNLGHHKENETNLQKLYDYAHKNELGVMIMRQHPRVAFGMQKNINLWLRDKSPNWHLAVLMALQLQINWDGKINLITVCDDDAKTNSQYKFLNKLIDSARFPSNTEFHVLKGTFNNALKSAPRSDVNIFGLGDVLNFEFMRSVSDNALSSCLYIKDSGRESALV